MPVKILLVALILLSLEARGQDELLIKVHFLHGSRPAPGYKDVERKWFGGILGGHAGIEMDNGQVFNFMKRGSVHLFASRRKKNSRFTLHTADDFWGIFRYPANTVKKTTVVIPVTTRQKQLLDSIAAAYLAETPYDYAFFGMRCGAATYEILAKLDIVKAYSYRRTFMKIFYPRKLRRRLLKQAEVRDWEIIRAEGSTARVWERD